MKRLVLALIGVAALVGVCAAAVHGFDDRELFVSPPDAVAEGFYREVITKRWSRAEEYLLQPVPQKDLEQLAEKLGDIDDVSARTGSRDDDWANVFVTLESPRGDIEVGTVVRWNGNEWKVSR